MAIVGISPQHIYGKFKSGIALDLHTLHSTPVGQNEYGHTQFETIRPAIAELLYQLKYKGDRSAAISIIDTTVDYMRPHRDKFDVIIPVPSSKVREIQPVSLLADGIGAALGIPVISCVSTTRATTELKGVTDPDRRKELLDGLYVVDGKLTRDKRVLLFDDLFRSGSTMNAITDALLGEGAACSVHALTITRARSNQ